MSALELKQLRDKVASLEDDKKKLLLKIDTLKKEHSEELSQLRELIQTMQERSSQLQNMYQKAISDLDVQRKTASHYMKRARDRKKALEELEKQVGVPATSNASNNKLTRVRSASVAVTSSENLHLLIENEKKKKTGSIKEKDAKEKLKEEKERAEKEKQNGKLDKRKSSTWSRSSSKDLAKQFVKMQDNTSTNGLAPPVEIDKELTRTDSSPWLKALPKSGSQIISPPSTPNSVSSTSSPSSVDGKSPNPVSPMATVGTIAPSPSSASPLNSSGDKLVDVGQDNKKKPTTVAAKGPQVTFKAPNESSPDNTAAGKEADKLAIKKTMSFQSFGKDKNPPSNPRDNRTLSFAVPPPEHDNKGVPTSASTLTLNTNAKTPPTSASMLNLTSNSKKLTLTVTSSNSDYTVTTAALSDWTVAETISRLKRKFPGATPNHGLYIKTGKKTLKKMDDDKKMSAYKELDSGNVTLVFQEPPKKRGTAGSSIRRIFSKESKPDVSILCEMISARAVSQVESMLNLFTASGLLEYNEFGQAPIHVAVNSSNLDMVKVFLTYYQKHSLDINVPDNYGWTVLHYAVSSSTGNASDEEILRLLLNFSGIQVDVSNNDSNTPLHYFCQKFTSPSVHEIGEILVKKAPATVNRKNRNGETPLHKAIFNPTIRVLMVKLLVQHGADVNIPTERSGETALHYAVRLGRKDLLKILLQAGADITVKDFEGSTPFDLAVSSSQEEVKKILQAALDLSQWLKEIDWLRFYDVFLKEELYLDVIVGLDETMTAYILDKLQITSPEMKKKFREACKVLKDKISKRQFELQIIKASKQKNIKLPPSSLNSYEEKERIGKLKQSLGALMEDNNSVDNETQWLIYHADLEMTKELGSGRSGMVFKGLFKGEKVAIKVLTGHISEGILEEFKKEFHIMCKLRSPWIVHFWGACLDPRLCIVMEYCSNGSLFHVLSRTDITIDWRRGVSFAMALCAALNFLHTHNPPVYHRDVKSLNLLVTDTWNVKLCDMGLARFNTAQQMQTMSKLCGTFAYVSPELYSGGSYTDKSDVFSAAIVIWEIVIRVIKHKYEIPYMSEFPYIKKDYQILFNVAKKDLRPTIPPQCNKEVAAVMRKMWAPNPADRPSAGAAFEALQEVIKTLPPSEDILPGNSTLTKS